MTVDPRAASGFANAVEAYERARPPWPAEAVAGLARELGLDGSSTVLDLAAGTGKLTRVLVPLVGRVVAVDPSAPMLAELRRRAPEADALEGTAEAIPLPDGSADAVFVAEAFHWFRTEPAAREIGRVLRPGGGLVLLWNRPHWDPAELPWLEAFGELLDPVRHDAGRFPAERDEWPDALAATGLFTPIERSGHEHVQRLPAEDLSTLVSSWSWIANLPDDRRAELLAQVDRLVAGERELPLRHRTEVCVAHLRD